MVLLVQQHHITSPPVLLGEPLLPCRSELFQVLRAQVTVGLDNTLGELKPAKWTLNHVFCEVNNASLGTLQRGHIPRQDTGSSHAQSLRQAGASDVLH